MTNRNGAICVQEQLRHRFADDVGAPRSPLLYRKIANRSFNIMRQPSGVHGTIASPPVAKRPVLITGTRRHPWRIDHIDHRLFVDLIREGPLHQNAVNRVVAVEPLDQRQKLFLRGRVGQHMFELCIPASSVAFFLLRT